MTEKRQVGRSNGSDKEFRSCYRVIVVEPVRHDCEHQPFNTSLLLTCHQAFPFARIVFLAENKHLKSVSAEILHEKCFEFLSINISARRSTGFKRLLSDWLFTVNLLKLLKNKKPDVLIFTSITKEILWSLKILHHRYNISVTIGILHAGLHSIFVRPRFNVFASFFSFRNALIKSKHIMRFLVLEQTILDTVASKDPNLSAIIGVLPHPLPPDLIATNAYFKKNKLLSPVKIGLLGLCTPQKGLFRFLEMAKYSQTGGNNRPGSVPLQFEIIGRLHSDSVTKAQPYLHHLSRPPSDKVLSREEFLSAIADLHFAAFLFEGDYYNVTASGVLLDCIALGIPIISDRAPFVNFLESKTFGPIGITGGETFKLDDLIKKITSLSDTDYQDYRTNIFSLSDERLPKKLAPVLLEELRLFYRSAVQ